MKRTLHLIGMVAVMMCGLVMAGGARASESLQLAINQAEPGSATTATISITGLDPAIPVESFSLELSFAAGSILTLPAASWFVRGAYFPDSPFGPYPTVQLNYYDDSTARTRVFIDCFNPAGTSGAIGTISFNVSSGAAGGETQVLSLTGQFYSNHSAKDFLPATAMFTVGTPLAPPVAPSSLQASDDTYTDKIRVTWTNVADETGYQVYRASTSDGSYTHIGTTGADVTTYDDSVSCQNDYYYKVKAYNDGGDSGYSPADLGSTGVCPIPPPPAPSVLTASDGTFIDRIRLTWTNVAGETGYDVYRSTTSNGIYTQVATTGTDGTTYDDVVGCGGTPYFYKVKAYNDGGDSGFSSVEEGSTGSCPVAAPQAPAVLTAADGTSMDTIHVAWTDVDEEDGYRIWRSDLELGTYQEVSTVGAGVTSYDDPVACETTYYYRVTAFNVIGESDFSPADQGSTGSCTPNIFQDSFSDGDATGDDHWYCPSASWLVANPLNALDGKLYKSKMVTKATTLVNAFEAPANSRILFDFKMGKANGLRNGTLLFSYVNSVNYRFVKIKQRLDGKWLVQVSQKGVVGGEDPGKRFNKVLGTFRVKAWHRLILDYFEDGSFNLYLDSESSPLISNSFNINAAGKTGLMTQNGSISVDNFTVYDLAP